MLLQDGHWEDWSGEGDRPQQDPGFGQGYHLPRLDVQKRKCIPAADDDAAPIRRPIPSFFQVEAWIFEVLRTGQFEQPMKRLVSKVVHPQL